MASVEFVTIEVADPERAVPFHAAAFGLDGRVRLQASDAPTSGFRGFTLSLIASQPADVDALVDAALEAGATALKPVSKSLWGYGGVVRDPDGTIWTVASSSKKNSGPASRKIDDFVLQLGVEDVGVSKRFYVERGFTVAKSYGGKYVELDTGDGAVELALYKRRALAKVAGVPADGDGSHRLVVGSDAGPFIDPDGFEWAAAK